MTGDPTGTVTKLETPAAEILRAAREARARALREMAWALGAWLRRSAKSVVLVAANKKASNRHGGSPP
jgi:hypothetical protein